MPPHYTVPETMLLVLAQLSGVGVAVCSQCKLAYDLKAMGGQPGGISHGACSKACARSMMAGELAKAVE